MISKATACLVGLMTLAAAGTASAGHPGHYGNRWHRPGYHGRPALKYHGRQHTVKRRVWVEPVYEYRTERVWVPKRCGLNFGLHRKNLHIDVGFGHRCNRSCGGYYDTVQRRVCVRQGYWKIVHEPVYRPAPYRHPRPVYGGGSCRY